MSESTWSPFIFFLTSNTDGLRCLYQQIGPSPAVSKDLYYKLLSFLVPPYPGSLGKRPA